jgi:CheY-like chemotaxis protein
MSNDDANAAGSGPRLLVVDDNEDNRYTLIMRLEIEGYSDITTCVYREPHPVC